MCHHDDLAAWMLAELRNCQTRRPGQADLAEVLDLTGVSQPFAKTGRIAISLLFAPVERAPTTGTSVVPGGHAGSTALAEWHGTLACRSSRSMRVTWQPE